MLQDGEASVVSVRPPPIFAEEIRSVIMPSLVIEDDKRLLTNEEGEGEGMLTARR